MSQGGINTDVLTFYVVKNSNTVVCKQPIDIDDRNNRQILTRRKEAFCLPIVLEQVITKHVGQELLDYQQIVF